MTGVNVIEVIVSQVVAYGVITSLQAVLLVVSGVYIVDVSASQLYDDTVE